MTSLIMPCYFANQKMVKMTQECYYSLKDTDYNDQVIIVDDGSPVQGNIGMTGLHKFIRLPQNKGYAGAVNAGLAEAEGDYLIICNNDIEFIQHDWLNHLLKGFNEGYDIVSIRTTDADGWLEDNYISEGDKFGSFWAMRREVYEKIGGLDESFGNYFEDLDYQKRAEDAGFKVGKNHAGIVHHYGKSTFKVIDPTDSNYLAAAEKFQDKWGEIW
jgi:GT2 family glycosyltransferase